MNRRSPAVAFSLVGLLETRGPRSCSVDLSPVQTPRMHARVTFILTATRSLRKRRTRPEATSSPESADAMSVWLQILGFLCSGLCALAWLAPVAYLAVALQRKTDLAYRQHIRKWASENGWDIVHCQRRKFGSPWMFSNTAQGIYHVTVLYQEGQPRMRRAWLRCGGWFLGSKTEKVEMRWDGLSEPLPEPALQPPPSRPQDDPLWDQSIDGW